MHTHSYTHIHDINIHSLSLTHTHDINIHSLSLTHTQYQYTHSHTRYQYTRSLTHSHTHTHTRYQYTLTLTISTHSHSERTCPAHFVSTPVEGELPSLEQPHVRSYAFACSSVGVETMVIPAIIMMYVICECVVCR